MKKHIKFPSIEQFRTVVKNIASQSEFEGLDENGLAIFNKLKAKPVLEFLGTVKTHGSNASIAYNDVDGIWFQSREQIITPQKDNAGFAIFCFGKQDLLIEMCKKVALENNVNLSENTVAIYFEWVGKGIQKSVAVSQIDKCAIVIACKISPFNEKRPSYWVGYKDIKNIENRIFNVLDYKTFKITVDFNNPLLSQNEIIDMTMSVEQECPVGKEFGVSDIGEGIVFSCDYLGDKYWFKSKGTLHQKSHVKTLSVVDVDRLNSINEVAEKVTPEWRLEQGVTETFDTLNGGEVTINRMGDYIKWVIADVVKEEMDVISESGFTFKDVSGKISVIAKNYLFKLI